MWFGPVMAGRLPPVRLRYGASLGRAQLNQVLFVAADDPVVDELLRLQHNCVDGEGQNDDGGYT